MKKREATPTLSCNWGAVREQLLIQWKQLTPKELDQIGPNRPKLAKAIGRKCGIASPVVENYLYNFEHTMPSNLPVRRAA